MSAVVRVAGFLLLVLLLAIASRRRDFQLDGKVVVVTGAASGIGRGLASKVARETTGATLVLLDIDLAALQELKTELLQCGRALTVLVYECDVSDYRWEVLGAEVPGRGDADVEMCTHRAVDECFARVVDAVAPQHIGVLVNNAGRRGEAGGGVR
ncbi:unnamed protein product [Phytophthora lilii]|uniref:Unnamed protein product n=1 Tax=Phytophthora lilii TaxID=2077276 RepID=A0A9W6U3H2_9STRA|nr:unnamed protein product [Phytophthora lilii]